MPALARFETGNPQQVGLDAHVFGATNRVATWTDTSSSSALESFAYDDSGNLLQQVRGGTTWNAVANGDNQLVSADGNAWDYDLVGNLIDDGQRTYLWDAENRLVKITNITTGATSEFSYDGLGRRVISESRTLALREAELDRRRFE